MSYNRGALTPSGKLSGPSTPPPNVKGHQGDKMSAHTKARGALLGPPMTQQPKRKFSVGSPGDMTGPMFRHLGDVGGTTAIMAGHKKRGGGPVAAAKQKISAAAKVASAY